MKNLFIKQIFRILLLFSQKRSSNSLKKILVISTTGFGDTLWATPALDQLAKNFPNVSIDLLTTPIGMEIFKDCPFLKNRFLLKTHSFWSQIHVLKKIRKHSYDAMFFFHTSQRMLIPLLSMANCPNRIGFKGDVKGLECFLTHVVSPGNTHQIVKRFRLLNTFFSLPIERQMHFYSSPSPVKILQELIETKKQYLVLHAGAKDRYKCASPLFLKKLTKHITEELGCEVILTGNKSEKDLAKIIRESNPFVRDLTGQLNLKQLAFALRNCSLMITADTGPMHLASALNTPLIALFGPTNANECGPLTPEATTLQKPPTCTPCIKKSCRDPFCMNQFSLNEVLHHVRAKLARR